MKRILKPEWFDVNPTAQNTVNLWRCWLSILANFLETLRADIINKPTVLTNHVSANVYDSFYEATTYEIALTTIRKICAKTSTKFLPDTLYLLKNSSRKKVLTNILKFYSLRAKIAIYDKLPQL